MFNNLSVFIFAVLIGLTLGSILRATYDKYYKRKNIQQNRNHIQNTEKFQPSLCPFATDAQISFTNWTYTIQ